jgi:hypothetical protein
LGEMYTVCGNNVLETNCDFRIVVALRKQLVHHVRNLNFHKPHFRKHVLANGTEI